MTATRTAICTVLVAQLMAGAMLHAQGNGRGKGKHQQAKYDDGRNDRSGVHADIHVVFSTRDTVVVREYYAPQHRNLPPGLRKKYARTGQLPPGWQKKMQPMPVAIERRLEPLPAGYHRGVFEGHAVIYRPGGLIIDAAVLF